MLLTKLSPQCRTKFLNGEEQNKINILRLIEKKRKNKVEKHQDDTDRATCIKLANGSKRDDDINY